jgi:hypothetical protein
MSETVALRLDWKPINGYRVCRPMVEVLFRFGEVSEATLHVLCRLDTGADFSEVPTHDLPQAVLTRLRRRRLRRRSPTGAGTGDLTECRFSFVWLSQYEFASECILNPDLRDYGLLALRDVLPHFRIQQAGPSPVLPLTPGSLQLQLRPDHGGQRV